MGGRYAEIESMKGIVLGYDAAAEAIVLRADNGRRYRFQATDWRERRSPRKGDPVDFEPDGDRARDVYLVAPAQHLEGSAPASPLSVVSDWGPVRFFLARPVFTFALLVLIACLTGAYAFGEARISLIEVPELISRMSESLDSLIAVSGTDPAPRLGAGFARILLVLLLGLYAVPILAALTLWREFIGRPDRRLARIAGIAAIVLPILLPLLVALVVQAWVLPGLPDAGARLGRGGVTTPQQMFEAFRLYATGTVLLIFAGLGLWAAASGRFKVPLGQRTIDEPVLEVPRQRPPSRIDVFAPLRRRGAKAKPQAPAAPPPPAAPARPFAPAPAPAPGHVPGHVDAPEPAPLARPAARKAPPPPQPVPQPVPPPVAAPPAADIADDIKTALETEIPQARPAPPSEPYPAESYPPEPYSADLPPRGGSVWPEPVGAPFRRPPPAEPAETSGADVDGTADQNR